MKNLYLVLDESGAKGFAKNREGFPGEIGVLAGYFVRANCIERVRHDFEAIRSRFNAAEAAKIHLTDLEPTQKVKACNAVFEYLKEYEMPTIYEAIRVQGFHEAAVQANELSALGRDGVVSDIRYSVKLENDRLLSALFFNVFGRAVAYAVDNFGRDVRLLIVTDRVDSGLIKDLRAAADCFLSAVEPKRKLLTGFDVGRKEVVTQEAELSFSGVEVEKARAAFKNVAYEISCEDSGLTFSADVIAHSVYKHLGAKTTQDFGVQLNSKRAISGHDLEYCFYGLSEDIPGGSLTDVMYRHPKGA